ncbi:MAG: hypothetical protein ANABAC_1286 [Anaerolineae bacterium]|nr:MAG: hypothetical protein ANABAC_1286 [Anaerolineae bacterium]
MKKTISILLLVILLMTPAAALAATPKFTILAVNPEKTVTISAEGLPEKQLFDVYMGRAGTNGINGVYVGSVSTNGYGRFVSAFTIPLQYSKDYQVDVLLTYSKNGKKFKYYTHFINRSQAASLTFLDIKPTRNIVLEIKGLQDESKYTIWMRANLVSTPYRAGMVETAKGKTTAKIQVPIPVALRGEPYLYVYVVDKLGYVYTSGWFYNR